MMSRALLSVCTLLVFLTSFSSGQTPFHLDSAAAYLRTLAVEIGPRPMGSPNERRAMEFALTKFRQFGLHDAYILPMKVAQSHTVGGRTNTNSGTAVGILKGKSRRIIVLGAHIDSATPEVPGANDDGSGSAVIIELARVLAQSENESTIVFALFGGEEEGLQGSRHFVENFPLMERVALMLQVDMANGTEWLLPLIDGKNGNAPQWLVEAAYEELRALGYRGFSYPMHFMSLNTLFGSGAITSDHFPFLERGIPAIDFTSNLNDPIHTPQDSYEHFTIQGLKRSGDLVYRLVERFDAVIPEQGLEQYFLVDVGMRPFFLPSWILIVVVLASLLLAGAALRRTYARHRLIDHSGLPKWFAAKLFLFMLIIQTCVWLSENIVGLVKGVRFPWFADMTGYFALGFVAATLGIWFSLRLARRLKLTTDPFAYFLRAVIFFCVLLVLLGPFSIRAALYPAVGLMLISLAMLVSNPVLRVVLWLLSPHMMYRLIFSEGFELMARSFAATPMRDWAAGGVLHFIYILFFSFWSFPFLLSFAALYRDSNRDLLWLKRFSTPRGMIGAFTGLILLVAYLTVQPSYNELWKPHLLVDEKIDYDRNESIINIFSTEYFNNLILSIDGRDTLLGGRSTHATLRRTAGARWMDIQRDIQSREDSTRHMTVQTTMRFARRPLSVVLTYSPAKGTLGSFVSTHEASLSTRTATLRWYSFPDTIIQTFDSFNSSLEDTVFQTVEAVFPGGTESVTIRGFDGNISLRSAHRMRAPLQKR